MKVNQFKILRYFLLQSPARSLQDGPTPSVGIPIPNGNNNRVRKMSDSDDQVFFLNSLLLDLFNFR